MTAAPRFQEIEHKYVVGDGLDLEDFRHRVQRLEPIKANALAVRDVYYLTKHQPTYIYRHRYDLELQHLTAKSLESDSQVRVEINLDLGQHRGDQQAVVEAFLETLEVVWRGVVQKDIEVYYFPDCEIVHYEARAGSRSVRCVEFEARDETSIDDAIAVLHRYRKLTGFEDRRRTAKTVVEILFPPLADRFRKLRR